jgi:hypothetical protein
MGSPQLWAVALALHFLVIGAVSFWDLVDLVGSGRTVLPQTIAASAGDFAQAMKSFSPRQLRRSNPIRQTIVGYAHITGVESPYTFFAPNVPESLKIVFEIHLRDNRVIYDVPSVASRTEGLRLSALIDQAVREPGLWRDVVLQMLAASAADVNPGAIRIRVIVTALKFPGPAEYRNGARPWQEFICSYDFKPEEARKESSDNGM